MRKIMRTTTRNTTRYTITNTTNRWFIWIQKLVLVGLIIEILTRPMRGYPVGTDVQQIVTLITLLALVANLCIPTEWLCRKKKK
jgi:hypothetical protein